MEASGFFPSSSFAKVGLRPPASKWRSPCGATGAITCTNMRSSDEGDAGDMQADWRSLRARLVAAEQSSLFTSNPPHTLSTTNNKWAHTLHAPEKGCLLVATHSLDGVHIFERTVILILTLIPTPTGIILNRPSLMSIKEANSTSIASADMFSEQPLLFGGPVDDGMFLVSSKKPGVLGVFDEVMSGVYYGGKESVGCEPLAISHWASAFKMALLLSSTSVSPSVILRSLFSPSIRFSAYGVRRCQSTRLRSSLADGGATQSEVPAKQSELIFLGTGTSEGILELAVLLILQGHARYAPRQMSQEI